ncbi:MAG: class I SAM-dependent methyltransferase [Candidatus Heimdallarchaeota archaeon]|nr:class I SAM-dependent methyltransferase [Candidatus Heimdallarchaeota archaeon]
MKEISFQLSNMNSFGSNAIHPINSKLQSKRKRVSFKERFRLGIMYQHPRIYDLALWLNDPKQLIPKTLAKSIEGKSVLDLGCGTATLQPYLSKDIEYIGIDLNENFLAFANRKNRGSFYKRNVLENLSDFRADTVVLSDVLHHVTPNHQKLLENALQCARKKVLVSACYEKEDGPFKRLSEFIGRKIIDNDGLNEQRAGAGWLRLDELLSFLELNGAINIRKVLSHIHCEIIKE